MENWMKTKIKKGIFFKLKILLIIIYKYYINDIEI